MDAKQQVKAQPDQYHIPGATAERSVVAATPEAPTQTLEQIQQEAMGYALDAAPANPEVVDTRRIEFGAAVTGAAQQSFEYTAEVAQQLLTVNNAVLWMRGQALTQHGGKK